MKRKNTFDAQLSNAVAFVGLSRNSLQLDLELLHQCNCAGYLPISPQYVTFFPLCVSEVVSEFACVYVISLYWEQ